MAGISGETRWHVRRATPDDAEAIESIRIATWRTAYRGIVQDAILEAMTVKSEQIDDWRRGIEKTAHPVSAWFVAEQDGDIVGFVCTGPANDEDIDKNAVAELYAIYVLPEHSGIGVGSALIGAARDHLTEAGFRSAVLWTLEGNARTLRFYDRHGWATDGSKQRYDKLGADVVRYRVDFSASR